MKPATTKRPAHCAHHRQRVGGEVLPCAHPACLEGVPGVSQLLVNTASGPLYFNRETHAARYAGGVMKYHYSWREAVS